MRRSEIRLVHLEPVIGSEAARTRPAVIVSNDGANTTARRLGRGVITVVPVTSNIDNIYPFQVLLSADETGLDVDSKAQAERVRSVAIERVGAAVIGNVPFHVMDRLDHALRLHLDL
jgi:mRNA interferase MazF